MDVARDVRGALEELPIAVRLRDSTLNVEEREEALVRMVFRVLAEGFEDGAHDLCVPVP
jgi:hypothetical protein